MKRIIAFLMVLALCVSLGACGGEASALSKEEKALVGEWLDATSSERDMVLTDSGRGLSYGESGSGAAFYWEVFEGKLYIYYEFDGGSVSSCRYTISGNQLLNSYGKVIFTKK